ncbi:MAG: HD domain-containing protein [Lachnospiraceae bacterium]|nr:HD domain-containing protein [Lachnospiraceae bacterium]
MFELLEKYQLNIMLSMESVAAVTALFVYMTRSLHAKRKKILMCLEITCMVMLFSDRNAYVYRGDTSTFGFYAVRITNFVTFLASIWAIYFYNAYLKDLFKYDAGFANLPKRLSVVDKLAYTATGLLFISQFTGLYYYFDEGNNYHRSGGIWICFALPLIMLIIQLSLIVQYGKRLSRPIFISLVLFSSMPLVATAAQFVIYGLSLTNMIVVTMGVLLYLFALEDLNDRLERASKLEIDILKDEQMSTHRLFDQLAKVFAGAIDERDVYSKGHSKRVADYSREIAKRRGLDEKECQEVYYSALLHDVGKICIPDSLLGKSKELTEEEIEIIRQNPVVGNRILAEIEEFPYLSTGAHYYNERYDGKGYPEGLKGDEIPEAARIIAVADAYDVMTEGTGYSDPMPDPMVREELLKGSGSRFDPELVAAMLDIMDHENELLHKERESGEDISWKNELQCFEYRDNISRGINITANITRITFSSEPDGNGKEAFSRPSVILFDSFDSKVHDTAKTIEEYRYMEYGEFWFDGNFVSTDARNVKLEKITPFPPSDIGEKYMIEAVKYRDHVRLRLYGNETAHEAVIALPDSSRWAYIGITGEHCIIRDIDVTSYKESIGEGEIERIADEVSYIDHLEGDIPNVQVDGTLTAATEGIEVKEDLRISFRTMSLPTANLVWHCPFVLLYSADDGKRKGKNYKELALFSLSGESWSTNEYSKNELELKTTAEFLGWDEWKNNNKKPHNVILRLHCFSNNIITTTENSGVNVKNVTTLSDKKQKVYVAITGDQCAMTDIMIM